MSSLDRYKLIYYPWNLKAMQKECNFYKSIEMEVFWQIKQLEDFQIHEWMEWELMEITHTDGDL